MDFYKTKSVEFGFCDNQFKPGVVVLNDTQTYKDNKPTPFGVQSLFLGATRQFPCAQCKLRYGSGPRTCPGHEGQIKLNTVVYAPGTIKYVVGMLRQVCFFCSNLLKSKGTDAPYGKRACGHCKLCQPVSWSVVYGFRIMPLWKQVNAKDKGAKGTKPTKNPKTKKPKRKEVAAPTLDDIESEEVRALALGQFTPQRALAILGRIRAKDFKFLGYHHPEKTQPKFFLWNTMPVVSTKFRPRCIRPDVAGKGLHDLTTLYHQLMKASEDLVKVRERIELYERIRGNISLLRKNGLNEQKYDDLRYKVVQLDDDVQVLVWLIVLGQDPRKTANKVKKSMYYPKQYVPLPPRSSVRMGGDGYASLLGLAVGNDKVHSITRGHISSKRCDMNARTVIAADPFLDIGYVGVPHTFCKTLTYPERVTDFNLTWLQCMVRGGVNALHGANTIIKKNDNSVYSLNSQAKIGLYGATVEHRKEFAQRLEVGDIVERHLVEGDPVVMNRQPTLHEGSIMGHRCKPVSGNAFMLPLDDVNSYNADCDGDEMNMHVPQTEKAKSDVIHVMGVKHHLLPSQMVVQGGILACYMLTSMDCILKANDYMNYVVELDKPNMEPTILVKNKDQKFDAYYTGSHLFSQVLHPDLVLDTSQGAWAQNRLPTGDEVVARNAQFLCGRASKSVLRKILHTLCLTTTPTIASTFMSQTSKLTTNYLFDHPKSIGPADMRPRQEVFDKIKGVVRKCTKLVEMYAPRLDNEELQSALMTIMNVVSSHMKNMIPLQESQRSALHTITTDAQSKGSFHNIVQISGYHGTNLLKGNLIVHNDPSAKRILPCFRPNPSRSELMQFGHVVNSFVEGHSSLDSFFDYMSGRIGLVDTAVTTGRTGYKGAEIGVNTTCRVAYGNAVLNYSTLLSPIYYGDGYNPDYVLYRKVKEFLLSESAFQDLLEQLPFLPGMDEHICTLRRSIMETKARSCMETLNITLDLPYDVTDLFTSEYYKCHTIDVSSIPLVPTKSWNMLEKLHKDMRKWATPESVKIVEFYDILNLGKLMQEAKFANAFADVAFFRKVLFRMEKCFANVLYAGGSQCGRSASMRISEKVTQIALDSHRSGGANHGGDGLKRFETILSLAQTPPYMASMVIDCDSTEDAHKIVKSICMVMFDSIVNSIQVEDTQDHAQEDADILDLAQDLHRLSGTYSHFFAQKNHGTYRSKKKPFAIATQIIRVVLNKPRCLEASVDIKRVARKIESRFLAFLTPISMAKTRAQFVCSASYMDEWKIRIMVTQKIFDGFEKKNKSLDMFLNSSVLRNLYVGGIENISSAYVAQREELGYDAQAKQFVKRTIPYVWTRGTNMRSAMSHRMIDPLRVTSNCMQDVRENLGTLAACNAFYCEMKDVMGNKVKDRHVFLLTQSILSRGIMCGVNRHGLRKSGTPIAQMCFENGRKVMMNLCMTNAQDTCQDDASAILLGRRSKGGTGAVHFKPKKTTHMKRKLATFSTKNTASFDNIVKRVRNHYKTKKSHQTDQEHDPEVAQMLLHKAVETWFGMEEEEEALAQAQPPAHPPSPKAYSPTSPAYNPQAYSPTSPAYNPQAYSPTSPNIRPHSPTFAPYSPTSPMYSQISPTYVASSPTYVPPLPQLCSEDESSSSSEEEVEDSFEEEEEEEGEEDPFAFTQEED